MAGRARVARGGRPCRDPPRWWFGEPADGGFSSRERIGSADRGLARTSSGPGGRSRRGAAARRSFGVAPLLAAADAWRGGERRAAAAAAAAAWIVASVAAAAAVVTFKYTRAAGRRRNSTTSAAAAAANGHYRQKAKAKHTDDRPAIHHAAPKWATRSKSRGQKLQGFKYEHSTRSRPSNLNEAFLHPTG